MAGSKLTKWSEEEIARCKDAMSKPAPMDALRLIASGRVVVELTADRSSVWIVELDGERLRDPDHPNDPNRKMGLAGSWPLYRAGMIDEFGCVTPEGRAALAAQQKGEDHG